MLRDVWYPSLAFFVWPDISPRTTLGDTLIAKTIGLSSQTPYVRQKFAIYTPKRVDESPTLLDGYPPLPGPPPFVRPSVRPFVGFSFRVSVLPINHQSINQRNKHLTSQSDNELINVPFFCHTITGTWSQSFVQLICWRTIHVTIKLKGCFSWLHHLILLQYLVSVHRWNENAGI